MKAQLKEYTGFKDEDIKDALWGCYSEVGPAVAALKSEYGIFEGTMAMAIQY